MRHKAKTRSKTRVRTRTRPKSRIKTRAGSRVHAAAASNTKPKTINEYLAPLSDDQRVALQKLRQHILAAAPAAVECISYQLPAFRLDGKLLVAFGAWANHCAFYPGAVMEDLGVELKGYDTSKGTIRFLSTHPLPATLVRKLVKARIAKNAVRQKTYRGRV
jgi:uncharacterized protein YdhG (YjbR/CyaY superfamily)